MRDRLARLVTNLRTPETRYTVLASAVSYAGFALSLLSAPILARVLGAEGRGELAAVMAPVQLLAWISFLGIPRGLAVTTLGIGKTRLSAIVVLTVMGALSAGLVWIFADVFASDDPTVATFMRVASLVLVLSGLASLGYDRALGKGWQVRVNVVRFFNVIAPSIGILVLALYDELSLTSAFIIQLSAQVIASILSLGLLVGAIGLEGARIPWRFSLGFWSTSALDSVAGKADQVVLIALAPYSDLGVYAVALTCASASGAFTQAVGDVAFSRFLKNSGEGTESRGLRSKVLQGMVASIVASVTVVVAVALLARPLFGPDYDDLPQIVVALCIAQLMNDQWRIRSYWDSAHLRSRELAISSIAGLALFAVAVTLIEVTGGVGAIGMALAMIVMGAGRLLMRAILVRVGTNSGYSARKQ